MLQHDRSMDTQIFSPNRRRWLVGNLTGHSAPLLAVTPAAALLPGMQRIYTGARSNSSRVRTRLGGKYDWPSEGKRLPTTPQQHAPIQKR